MKLRNGLIAAALLLGLADLFAADAKAASRITNVAEWQGTRPVSLPGLTKPRVESVLIYQPTVDWTYSHHPSITYFRGHFYAIWSNGLESEDRVGQRVLMSTSVDFWQWTKPQPLIDSMTDSMGVGRVLTAAGFHQREDLLVAYFCNYGPHKENTQLQAVSTKDGSHWDDIREIGIPVCPNHGPQVAAAGRLIISGNTSFPYTDDPNGLKGWKMSGIYPPEMASTYQDNPSSINEVALRQGWPGALSEGSFFRLDDGRLQMLLRNTSRQAPRHLWLSQSHDNGATWSSPVETAFSDTSAKFHFGRLPDGRYYYVGNPIGSNRSPLVLSISSDGVIFDVHYVLGDGSYVQRREGWAKGGEYGYPHTLIHGDHLYVIVSRKKEAVEVIRIKLDAL